MPTTHSKALCLESIFAILQVPRKREREASRPDPEEDEERPLCKLARLAVASMPDPGNWAARPFEAMRRVCSNIVPSALAAVPRACLAKSKDYNVASRLCCKQCEAACVIEVNTAHAKPLITNQQPVADTNIKLP